MARFKKIISAKNVKYFILEVALIFIGLTLAIWFNNWNENRKTNISKDIVLSKIRNEINNNYHEIEDNIQDLDTVIKTIEDFKRLSGLNNTFKASLEELNIFQKINPNFFTIKKSKKLNEGKLYEFNGSITLRFEITNLKFIAFETAKSTNILSKIKYNCLYELEDLYSQKYRISRLLDKAVELLQEGKFQELMRNLKQVNLLQIQLLEQRIKYKTNLNDC
ncbi:hypothetical protein [Winogradskyella haliclonae]|uniref:Uncharacterized protein n=1 Tax=Winogradskyella haliclonae TaxID=2048558 RepID=A0ABQ2BW59_9FLAO|nr:hypothetical protein [Winogradskyella haliclonae]GGI56721.1 hypothetical protein GCM10011444_10300 [Winogradskyella haliclonae]